VKKILLILSITFLSTQLFAEGFNDNYIQLGYSTSDYKHVDKITNIKGSAEFGNNYSIWGDYFYETGDWDDPGEYETLIYNKLLIGIGKSFPISDKTNITSSLILDRWNNKQTRQATGSSLITNSSFKLNVTEISLGIKNLIAPRTELSLKNNWGRLKSTSDSSRYYYYRPKIGIRHISESGIESSAEYFKVSKFGSNPIQSRLEIGLIKHINKNFAIGGRFLSVKQPDWTENGIFVRRSF
jgi:hypothetical protein